MSLLTTLLSVLSIARTLEPTQPDLTQLHEVTAISHRTDEALALLDGVRTALGDRLSDADRRRLGRKVLSDSRVKMVSGAFPSNGTTVVTVNVPLRNKDPLAEPKFISGVFTLDAAGSLADVVVPPKMQAQRFDLQRIGDVDRDGFDDLELAITGGGSDERRIIDWHAPASDASDEG